MQRAMEVGKERHREQQSMVMERLGRAILAQDQAAVDAIQARISAINEDAIERGRPDLIIKIDRNQLKQRIAEMADPQAAIKRVPKLQRQRYQELQELYGVPPPP
jgi:hypothetical protein